MYILYTTWIKNIPLLQKNVALMIVNDMSYGKYI